MESSQSAIAIPIANLSPTTAALSSFDIANILRQLSVVSGNTSTAMFATTGTSTWPFYFAYSNHMTPRSDIFTTTSSAAHVPAIHTADGSRMHAKHIGHVSIPHLSLSQTYYLLALSLNLIFGSQLCDLGLTVTFSSSGCLVQDP
ncbi:hypothetical protein AAC387_Pa02g0989 [Persea americana]